MALSLAGGGQSRSAVYDQVTAETGGNGPGAHARTLMPASYGGRFALWLLGKVDLKVPGGITDEGRTVDFAGDLARARTIMIGHHARLLSKRPVRMSSSALLASFSRPRLTPRPLCVPV